MKDYMEKVLPLGSVVRLSTEEEKDVEYVLLQEEYFSMKTLSMTMVGYTPSRFDGRDI